MQKKLITAFWPVTLLGFILSACAHYQPVREVDLADSAQHPETLLAVDYQFQSPDEMIQTFGCQVRIKNISNGRGYQINLKPPGELLMVELEPGPYRAVDFWCHQSLAFNFDEKDTWLLGVPFIVTAGKVNYLGDWMFKHGDRDGGLQYALRTDQINRSLVEVFSKLPRSASERLVSAQDGTPITHAQVLRDNGKYQLQFDPPLRQDDDQIIRTQYSQVMSQCVNREFKKNMLQIGGLKYQGTVSRGDLADFKLEPRLPPHYSDTFHDCVRVSFLGIAKMIRSKGYRFHLQLTVNPDLKGMPSLSGIRL